MATTETCVCCGAPVPEGRQVCWQCEHPKPCPCDGCQKNGNCTGQHTGTIGCSVFQSWFRFTWRWMQRMFEMHKLRMMPKPKPKRNVFIYYSPNELKGGDRYGEK